MDFETENNSDEELVQKALAGSQSAFSTLFNRHYQVIYQLSYRLCGNTADAADVSQDVFIKVAGNLAAFERRGTWRGWLYRMTLNRVRDYQRKFGRYHEIREAYSSEPTAKPENTISEMSHRVAEAVKSLPHPEKEAVILTFYEGLNHAEAAKLCGCAETTISWRVYQAKRKLKKRLLEDHHDFS